MKVLTTEMNRILNTKDYSIFKINTNNRVYNSKIEALTFSISEKDLSKDFPILVDKNYNILDGKYRFIALKELNKDVYYKISEVSNYLDVLKAKNFHTKPTLLDFANCHLDKLAYRKLIEYNQSLPYSIEEILQRIFDYSFAKKDYRIKEYKDFVNGNLLYNSKVDFMFNSISKIVDEIYNKNSFIEPINEIFYLLSRNSFNTDKALKSYISIPFYDKIVEWHKSGHPNSVTPLNFPFMVEDDLEENYLDFWESFEFYKKKIDEYYTTSNMLAKYYYEYDKKLTIYNSFINFFDIKRIETKNFD